MPRAAAEIDVDPDEVHQLERAHRKARFADRGIDRLDRRLAGFDQAERLDRERPVDPVDDEARLVGRPDRGLVPRAEQPLRALDHRRIRVGCDDHFDERPSAAPG